MKLPIAACFRLRSRCTAVRYAQVVQLYSYSCRAVLIQLHGAVLEDPSSCTACNQYSLHYYYLLLILGVGYITNDFSLLVGPIAYSCTHQLPAHVLDLV